MMPIFQFSDRRQQTWLWSVSILLVLVVGTIDYLSGYEISVVLFYSLPILLMVWFGARVSAFLIALLCAITWWWADEASGHIYSQDWHQIWETVVRLVYFMLFVVGGSAIKSRVALLEHLRQLEQEIIRVSEREQQRIGQDLHDGICQYFAAVGCAAGSLRRNLEKHGAGQTAHAAEIEDLIMKGVAQTRSLARGLFPVEDQENGLQSALQTLADSANRLLDLKCTFECEQPVPVFDNLCATHLYRIAQESISNANRHAQADSTVIRLSRDETRVSLTIADNGVGISPDAPREKGLGLGIMQYRARMIGGDFAIASEPGGGTVVRCSFVQKT